MIDNEPERRRTMDVEMAEIKTNIEYIKKSIDENSEEHKELMGLIQANIDYTNRKFESLDNKYASKSTEFLVKKVMWVIFSSFLTFLVSAMLYLLTTTNLSF